jgi:hypothetical protein
MTTQELQERTNAEAAKEEQRLNQTGGQLGGEKPLSTADLASSAESRHGAGTAIHSDEHAAPLFAQGEAEQFRSRWNEIQTGFVDEPRNAVQQADELVARCIKRLAEIFAEERTKMEHEWDRGDSVSTEDLRLALRRYRSFFDWLLSV